MSSNRPAARSLSRSLNRIILAGSFSIVFFTIFGTPVGSPLFTGFLRALGAGDFVYSVVMALPVAGAVAQVFGSYYLERTARRRWLFFVSGFVQRLSWVPVALLPLWMGAGLREACIWAVTVFVTLSSVTGSVNNIAYNSWVGDLVPADIAGRYFGRRTLINTAVGGVAGIAVALFVDRVHSLFGFAVVFLAGVLFGVADVATYLWVDHPSLSRPPAAPSLKSLLTGPLQNRRYMKLTWFVTLYNFGVNIAGPFFNVYMIENLRMSYFVITMSNQIMTALTTVLFVHFWGVMADRYGNRPVELLGAAGIVTLLVPWMLVTPGHIWLIYMANLFNGLYWSAYNLAVFNQSVWMAPAKNRSAYIACFTLFTNVLGMAVAFVCGGLLMQYVGPVVDGWKLPFAGGRPFNRYQGIFIVSTALRLTALLGLFPGVEEEGAASVRAMAAGQRELLRARLGLRPGAGLVRTVLRRVLAGLRSAARRDNLKRKDSHHD